MTNDPLRNHTDDWFIEELNKHISNEPVSTLIQDYIKKLVSHEKLFSFCTKFLC